MYTRLYEQQEIDSKIFILELGYMNFPFRRISVFLCATLTIWLHTPPSQHLTFQHKVLSRPEWLQNRDRWCTGTTEEPTLSGGSGGAQRGQTSCPSHLDTSLMMMVLVRLSSVSSCEEMVGNLDSWFPGSLSLLWFTKSCNKQEKLLREGIKKILQQRNLEARHHKEGAICQLSDKSFR